MHRRAAPVRGDSPARAFRKREEPPGLGSGGVLAEFLPKGWTPGWMTSLRRPPHTPHALSHRPGPAPVPTRGFDWPGRDAGAAGGGGDGRPFLAWFAAHTRTHTRTHAQHASGGPPGSPRSPIAPAASKERPSFSSRDAPRKRPCRGGAQESVIVPTPVASATRRYSSADVVGAGESWMMSSSPRGSCE